MNSSSGGSSFAQGALGPEAREASLAALKVFESFFGKQATVTGPIHSD